MSDKHNISHGPPKIPSRNPVQPNKYISNASKSTYSGSNNHNRSFAGQTSNRDTRSEYGNAQSSNSRLNKTLDERLNYNSQNPPDSKRRKLTQKKYNKTPDAWDKYKQITKIGQGTFGEVFKAERIKPDDMNPKNDVVAMKRVLMENEKEGFPITALREIKILQTLNRTNDDSGSSDAIGYENIVRLIEICREIRDKDSPSVFLVFEFCEHDLHGLLNCKEVEFSMAEKKSIVQQMLRGLMYVHGKRIFHRDVKTSNVLVTKSGVVKLADFGLARPSYVTSSRQLTNNVVTLWYRPPELILGASDYTASIDVWGCGCIMAELWTRGAIFQARDEMGQIQKICETCGSIEENDWPKVTKLKKHSLLNNLKFHSSNGNKTNKKERQLKKKFEGHMKDPLALSLLDDMLKLNPEKRITANSALDNYWFWEKPMPQIPDLSEIENSQFDWITREKKKNEVERQRGKNRGDNIKKDARGFENDHAY